jgi:hypothetical protein
MHDDFSGHPIVPFCSMGGGRFGQKVTKPRKGIYIGASSPAFCTFNGVSGQ